MPYSCFLWKEIKTQMKVVPFAEAVKCNSHLYIKNDASRCIEQFWYQWQLALRQQIWIYLNRNDASYGKIQKTLNMQ